MAPKNAKELLDSFLRGDRYALAKILTHAENGSEDLPFFFDGLYGRVGKAVRIGITGPPGAGKSTLVEALSRLYRAEGRTVGVIAVDPTSPFSGGALLGDRVRMQKLNLDEGIFVRSMASRGSVGGLARATDEAADIMDAFGLDVLLIETVGVGQSEVDVASSVDSTVVVLFPGAGDMIQAMKAGLMEIADLFVVNKADLSGADLVQHEIADSLELRKTEEGWSPPILKCSAAEGDGLEELKQKLHDHQEHLIQNGLLSRRRRDQLKRKIRDLMKDLVESSIWERYQLDQRLDASMAEDLGVSPFRLAKTLVKDVERDLLKGKSGS